MNRKLMRSMARHQLEKEGRKRINKRNGKRSLFAVEWEAAYIRNLADSLRKQGKNVRIVRRES